MFQGWKWPSLRRTAWYRYMKTRLQIDNTGNGHVLNEEIMLCMHIQIRAFFMHGERGKMLLFWEPKSFRDKLKKVWPHEKGNLKPGHVIIRRKQVFPPVILWLIRAVNFLRTRMYKIQLRGAQTSDIPVMIQKEEHNTPLKNTFMPMAIYKLWSLLCNNFQLKVDRCADMIVCYTKNIKTFYGQTWSSVT